MMEKEDPIYDFKGVKSLLTSMGYVVKKAEGYREIENVELDLNDVKKNMEISEEGIFLIDSATGSRQQIFLYKRDYYLEQYGKPRFHICKCEKIEEFINIGRFSDYRRANTESVMVRDKDDGYKDKEISNLPLCQYCAKMKLNYRGMDSNAFVELLKQSKDADDDPKTKEVDIFGYTKEWETISREYREAHNYTCERCGLTIDDPFDRQFIHVHHKNGDKTNNKESNLECLCIKCHSQSDDAHKRNFSSKANKKMLDDFEKKYGRQRKKDNE